MENKLECVRGIIKIFQKMSYQKQRQTEQIIPYFSETETPLPPEKVISCFSFRNHFQNLQSLNFAKFPNLICKA